MFLQNRQDLFVQRFNSGNDEPASELCEFWEMLSIFQNVLNLSSEIESETWERLMHCFLRMGFHQRDELGWICICDAEIDTVCKQIIGIERCVKPVHAYFVRCPLLELTDTFKEMNSQSQSGVHRDGYTDEACALNLLNVQRFYGNINRIGSESYCFKGAEWAGKPNWSVPEFVARD